MIEEESRGSIYLGLWQKVEDFEFLSETSHQKIPNVYLKLYSVSTIETKCLCKSGLYEFLPL